MKKFIKSANFKIHDFNHDNMVDINIEMDIDFALGLNVGDQFFIDYDPKGMPFLILGNNNTPDYPYTHLAVQDLGKYNEDNYYLLETWYVVTSRIFHSKGLMEICVSEDYSIT